MGFDYLFLGNCIYHTSPCYMYVSLSNGGERPWRVRLRGLFLDVGNWFLSEQYGITIKGKEIPGCMSKDK